jgi:hypothetical protein
MLGVARPGFAWVPPGAVAPGEPGEPRDPEPVSETAGAGGQAPTATAKEAPVLQLNPPAENEDPAADQPAARLAAGRAIQQADAGAAAAVTSRWYGWQTLIGDGAALAVMLGGAAAREPKLLNAGYALFLLGPPVVHTAHGNWGRGLASAGIRLAAPPILGLGGLYTGIIVGAIAGGGDSDDTFTFAILGGAAGFGLGVLAGYASAVAFDVFMARDKVADQSGAAKGQAPLGRSAGPRVAPTLAVDRGGATLGVAGRF